MNGNVPLSHPSPHFRSVIWAKHSGPVGLDRVTWILRVPKTQPVFQVHCTGLQSCLLPFWHCLKDPSSLTSHPRSIEWEPWDAGIQEQLPTSLLRRNELGKKNCFPATFRCYLLLLDQEGCNCLFHFSLQAASLCAVVQCKKPWRMHWDCWAEDKVWAYEGTWASDTKTLPTYPLPLPSLGRSREMQARAEDLCVYSLACKRDMDRGFQRSLKVIQEMKN